MPLLQLPFVMRYTYINNDKGCGMSPFAQRLKQAVPAARSTPPSMATNISTNKTSNSASISWAAPTSNGGSPITGYIVGRDGTDANNGGPWSTTVPANTLTFQFTNLSPNTSYTLSVTAVNAIGSGPTASATIVTDANALPTTGDLVARTYWGAYAGGNTLQTFQALQTNLQTSLQVTQYFVNWDSDFYLNDVITYLHSQGSAGHRKVLMICWEPMNIYLADIINGSRDTYIRNYIAALAQYQGRVIVRTMHEANGNWYTWSANGPGDYCTSAAQYKQAFQHIYTIAKSVPNAENVLLYFCANSNDAGGPSMETIYPGNNYVDIIGCDAYAWDGNTSFETIHTDMYQRLCALNPTAEYWVGETGRNSQTNSAAWYDAAYKCQSFPRMKGLLWFSENEFSIDSDAAALAIHRTQLQRVPIPAYAG